MIWLAAVLIAPAGPVVAVFRNADHGWQPAFVFSYILVLSASLLLAAQKTLETKWSAPWFSNVIFVGIGFSILGSLIAAVTGFAGCTLVVLGSFRSHP